VLDLTKEVKMGQRKGKREKNWKKGHGGGKTQHVLQSANGTAIKREGAWLSKKMEVGESKKA